MKTLYSNIFLISIIFTISSCSSNDNDQKELVNDTDQLVEQVSNESSDDNIFYQVPTPNELFAVLKNANVTYNKECLNDVANSEKYITKASKALNFGVYTADLAYVTSLGNFEDASPLFETVRDLAKELEIENAIDQIIFQRLQENLENSNADSLFYLSNETYHSAYTYLEENDRKDVLAMIVVGGWVEGLSIILNLEPYSENSEICQRIADQKLTLENLLIFSSSNNNLIPDIVSELENINEVFLASNDNEEDYTESTNVENDKGVMVFGGGSPSSLSEEQFNQLKSIVMDLRTSIIEGN
jgi:hypothetical protein